MSCSWPLRSSAATRSCLRGSLRDGRSFLVAVGVFFTALFWARLPLCLPPGAPCRCSPYHWHEGNFVTHL